MSLRKSLIAFVTDKKMAHDQAYGLVRCFTPLKMSASVDVIPGDCTDDELLLKFQAKPYSLILLPWNRYSGHRYQLATKIEGGLGSNRMKGTVLAGYFGETTQYGQLDLEPPSMGRVVMLDLVRQEPREICQLIASMLNDEKRTGLTSFVDSAAAIYTDLWTGSEVTAGSKMDMVLALQEIQSQEIWLSRQGAIRSIVSQLWGLIYQEGPGRSSSQVKSYFQVALDPTTLVFRLIYTQPNWTSKEIVSAFWPRTAVPQSPFAELVRVADWVRVHPIADSTEIEVTVGLTNSATTLKHPEDCRSLWIDPTTKSKITEDPQDIKNPRLKPFTSVTKDVKASIQEADTQKEKFMFEAAVRIKNLQKLIAEKDALIQELRVGGVGMPQILPPPDTESLLESFCLRFSEYHHQLEQLAKHLEAARASGANPTAIDAANVKFNALIKKEAGWIEKITPILTQHQKILAMIGATPPSASTPLKGVKAK